jgi:predicted nucleic acid-binding Zn ribbon protein
MVEPGDHRHCKVCGKVCATGSETCSKACARERERRAETRRNYSYLLYAMIAFLVLLFASSFIRL